MVAASHMTLFVMVFVLGAHSAQVTPMQQVIKLLKELSAKVTSEGKKEAEQYDKYACFCKEQADLKSDSIALSNNKMDGFSAEMKQLDSAIAELNSEIGDLSGQISDLDGELDDNNRRNLRRHKKYMERARDMTEAIDACEAAIDALNNHKAAMEAGGAKTTNLVQVQQATGALLSVVSQEPSVNVAPGTLALLSDLSAGAPKYQYQSNDIIATIESLQATFKSMKQDLDEQEFNANADHESEQGGLSMQKKFAEEDKAEKETIEQSKTEALNLASSDRSDEKSDRDADQVFLEELDTDCSTKGRLFDQRSKMRGEELTALSDATQELLEGTVPNAGANNIAGVAIKAVVQKAAIRPTSFLQVKNTEQHEVSAQQVSVEKVIALLNRAAGRTGSSTLTSAAVRVKMAEDHFVKVRALIKDLMAKLKNNARDEASQKSMCDTGMKKATGDRDDAMSKIEMANAKITTLTAKQGCLEDDIRELEKGVAGLSKGLLEDTELRNEEKGQLAKVDNMSDEAIESVKRALGIIQKFYSNALLQTGKFTAPNADRDGNVMGDMAPKVFEKKYHASQKESQGIIGILEVILSDFERTENQAEADEKSSKSSFVAIEKTAKGRVAAKHREIKKKENEVAAAKADILDQQQALSDATDILDSAKETREDLSAMCVAGEETWEERKKAREDEIAALHEAVVILDNWKN
jgi:hypothetical protein